MPEAAFLGDGGGAVGAALIAGRAGFQAAASAASTANNELCFMSASTLAKMIAKKQVSSVEVVEEKRPPNAEKADRIGVAVDLTEESVATMRGDLKKCKADNDSLASAVLGWVDEWLAKTPPADREQFRAQLPELRTSFLRFMDDHEVLLMPVMLRPAPGHGASLAKENLDDGYPGYVNLVGSLPAGTVRCGTSPEGLPIGVMVVGARWREDIVLAVLAHFESVFGGWQRPQI